MNSKLFSTAAAAAVLALTAGSAFAAADGPDYSLAAAQGASASRAEVNAQAVQAQREAHALYANADGAQTLATAGSTRSRAEVKAEAIEAVRVASLGLVYTPY